MLDLAFTPETRMLVDGELIPADSGKTFANINPATEEVLGQVADVDRRDAASDQRRTAGVRRVRPSTNRVAAGVGSSAASRRSAYEAARAGVRR